MDNNLEFLDHPKYAEAHDSFRYKSKVILNRMEEDWHKYVSQTINKLRNYKINPETGYHYVSHSTKVSILKSLIPYNHPEFREIIAKLVPRYKINIDNENS